MAVSRAAVSDAMSAGGNQFAPAQTRSALEKMESAERARSAKAQEAAAALQEDIRVLREELERQTK
jgi:hypothetical protein